MYQLSIQCPVLHPSTHPSHVLQCIKFKTYSSIFLNRFEALNLSLIEKMQNRRVPAPPPSAPAAAPEVAVGDTSVSAAPSSATLSVAGPAAGGVKKKKPKKKK